MQHLRSDLVVCISRRPELVRFLGVLQDWSSLNLVDDFVYVDADSDDGEHGPDSVYVTEGAIQRGPLSKILAGLPNLSKCRVACVSQISGEISSVGAELGDVILRQVRDALPSVEISQVHLIGVAAPSTWKHVSSETVAWRGFHNVLLAPENAQSPRSGVVSIGSGELASPVGLTHHAAGLCSALGLWVGENRTFVDDEPPAGPGRVFALRTFSRHLSVATVRSDILMNLVDMHGGYPIPSSDEDSVLLCQDEESAAIAMSKTLIGLHESEIFPKARRVHTERGQIDFTLGEQFRSFVTHLGRMFKVVPRAVADGVSAQSARMAQRVLIGPDDAVLVATVNGIRGVGQDQKIAEKDSFGSALEKIISLLPDLGDDVARQPAEFVEFWKDFLNGGMTLLDAKVRTQGLELPGKGFHKTVVSNPGAVAPDPMSRFVLSDHVRNLSGVSELEPCDLDLQHTLIALLDDRIESSGTEDLGLSIERDHLKEWSDSLHGSYVTDVGNSFISKLDKVRNEVVKRYRDIDGAINDSNHVSKLKPDPRKLDRNIWSTLGLGFLAVIVMSWAAYVGYLPGASLYWLIPLVGVGSIGISFGLFSRNKNRHLHAKREQTNALNQLETHYQNLKAALIDLRGLQTLYNQYVSWARAFSVFIWNPLGNIPKDSDGVFQLGESFCHNHQFGFLVPDEGVTRQAAHVLKSGFFKVGWLDKSWEHFMQDLPEFQNRHLLVDNPNLVFTDRAVAKESVLLQWSHAVANDKRRSVSKNTIERVDHALEERKAPEIDRLFDEVKTISSDGQEMHATYEEFTTGLSDPKEGDATQIRFSSRLFSPVQETPERERVASVLRTGGRGSVGPLIMTERSNDFVAEDLVFCFREFSTSAGESGDETSYPSPQV